MPPASASISGESCPDLCPSSPHSEVSQFSLSLYVLEAFPAIAPALELKGSGFVVHLYETPQSLAALCISQRQSLLFFTAKCYGDYYLWW